MFKFFKKTVVIPERHKQTEVMSAQLWSVRWRSLRGTMHSEIYCHHVNQYPDAEFFTSENDAKDFAEALTNAFALIRHTGLHTEVTIQKEKCNESSV